MLDIATKSTAYWKPTLSNKIPAIDGPINDPNDIIEFQILDISPNVDTLAGSPIFLSIK